MKNLLLILLTTLSLYSCNNKDTYIQEFGKFMNDTENVNEDYSDHEWALIEIQFDDLYLYQFEEYKDDLTKNDLKQIKNFKYRFTKIQVNREPLKNILKIIGL